MRPKLITAVLLAWMVLAWPLAGSTQLARVVINGKYGLIDTQGNWVIQPTLEGAGQYQEGAFAAKDAGAWGYQKADGSWLVKPTYALAGAYSDGLAAVSEDGKKVGFIRPDGTEIIPPRYSLGYGQQLTRFAAGLAPVADILGRYGYVAANGDTVLAFTFDYATVFTEGLARVVVEGRWALIDTSGCVHVWLPEGTLTVTEVTEGLAWYKREGRWALVDTAGRPQDIKQNRYEYLEAHEEGEPGNFDGGLAPVRLGSKWGYLRAGGGVAIPPQYDEAGAFYAGLAPVRQGQLWGYIDVYGGWAIQPQYEYAYSYSGAK
jgi:WG containing repeat